MRRIKLVDICRLCRIVSGDLVKLNIKRCLDATEIESLDTLLNLNLFWEAEVYAHDILWKFGGKQCIEKDGITIPLKYLPCKGKLFIEGVDNATNNLVNEIEVDYEELGETIKKPLTLGRVTVKELQ